MYVPSDKILSTDYILNTFFLLNENQQPTHSINVINAVAVFYLGRIKMKDIFFPERGTGFH